MLGMLLGIFILLVMHSLFMNSNMTTYDIALLMDNPMRKYNTGYCNNLHDIFGSTGCVDSLTSITSKSKLDAYLVGFAINNFEDEDELVAKQTEVNINVDVD